MEKSNFRVRVMKYAHQLAKTTEYTWKICLIKAWELYRLAKNMRKGIVRFAFKKVDGTIRHATGTLYNLPAGSSINGKKMTKPSYKTFAYFDVDKSEMRCFKIENLITIY